MEFKSYLRCPAYFESMMNLDGMGWLQTKCKHVKLVRKFAQLRRITHFQCAQILWVSHCTPKHIHTLHNIHPSYFPHWNLSSLLLASPKNAHGGMRGGSQSWMSSRYLFFKARAHSSPGKKEYLISVCSISLCVVKYQVYIFSISSYMLAYASPLKKSQVTRLV